VYNKESATVFKTECRKFTIYSSKVPVMREKGREVGKGDKGDEGGGDDKTITTISHILETRDKIRITFI
jgi:hypothetical protein